MTISLEGILTENNEEFVDEVIGVYSIILKEYSLNPNNKVLDQIRKFVRTFSLYELDLFSLRLLTEAARNPLRYRLDQGVKSNFSTIIERYCLGKESNIDDAAKLAFETFNLNVDESPERIDNIGWGID